MLFLPFLDDFCPLSFSMPGEVAMGVCSGKNQAAMLMWYICGTYVAHMWHGHKNQRRKHIGPFKLCTFGSRCSIRVENEN
jgi:hypothetical protein